MKIKVKGKQKKDNSKDDRGTLFGLFAAHEQIKLESNDSDGSGNGVLEPKGGVNGSVIAEHACDAEKGKVKERSELKKGDLNYNGEIVTTDFVISNRDEGHYSIGFSVER